MTQLKYATAVLALGLLAGTADAKVVVSPKIDTEGGVLGNIILLALQNSGIEVEDRIQLGGTPVVRKAILAGDKAAAQGVFQESVSVIDRIADKKIVHKNAAARTKSRLSAQIKALGVAA